MKVTHVKSETPGTVYIGRPSPLGNIYHIGKDGTREQVIEKYENFARNSPKILDIIRDLPEDSILGCYCYPLKCHGDVIVKLWKEMHDAK